jgi:hypothetical protein
MRTEETMEETEDELVPFARVVEELGWPAYKVRLALGKAGKELRKAKATRHSRAHLYPLAHTVRLLREGAQAESDASEVESEVRVPFEQIVRELGSSPNTVRRYLRSARRAVIVFSDPRDNRKKLYPLAHTLKVLRREETRIQARRDRSRNQGAGYWLAVAELKVAAAHLQEISSSLAAAARRVSAAHGALRKSGGGPAAQARRFLSPAPAGTGCESPALGASERDHSSWTAPHAPLISMTMGS